MGAKAVDIINEAKKFLGDDYVYGASGPNTFDCSGLAQYVYKQVGITIPRTSEEQFKGGKPVSEADAVPGTLVFFGGNGYDGTPSSPGHVGIYIGNGKMIDAPYTGAKVRVDDIDGNVGFRDYGIQGASGSSALSAGIGAGIGQLTGLGAGLGTGGGGLFSIPDQITSFFSDTDKFFTNAYHGLALFFKPSTYVRIGAGVFGVTFLITGLVLLMREART